MQIDQTPLTSSKTVAPNIVLMMDDSGSMAWGYMPDWQYLDDTGNGSMDYQINGVYYNPYTHYKAPPKADGTFYPDSPSLTQAFSNGFTNSSLTNVIHSGNYVGYRINYGVNLSAKTSHDYTADYVCPNGYHQDPQNADQCLIDNPDPPTPDDAPWTWACPGADSYYQYQSMDTGYDPPKCKYMNNSTGEVPVYEYKDAYHRCPANHTYNEAANQCLGNTPIVVDTRQKSWTCPNGGSVWADTPTSGLCHTRDQIAVFRYFTGPKGQFTVHYVAANGQCDDLLNATDQSACVDESTVGNGTNGAPQGVVIGKNIANWFSYYRTRMLTAKTGLMTALADMQPTTRFGFGSINGNNLTDIPTPKYGYQSAATSKDNDIAKVEPFGNGSSDTQKAKFWNWLANLPANGETPLREALNEVGKYYETTQPWETDPSASSTNASELACRQSYTILTSDGFWNGPEQSIQGAPSDGNIDGHPLPTIHGSNNIQSYTYAPRPPFSDGYGHTLADIALHYWGTDLRPEVPNEVAPGLEDKAFWQHMSLFTLGMGFQPEYIGGTVDNGNGGTGPVTVPDIFNWAFSGGQTPSNFSWPSPSANNIRNIADLVHAAVNGHGGYYSALDPASFTAGIKSALQRIQQRLGSGASLGANSANLRVGSVTYQAVFSTGKWNGDLQAFNINPATGVVATNPNWGAAAQMPSWDDRDVWTYNPKGSSGHQAVQIQATNDSQLDTTLDALSSAEKAALGSRLAGQSAADQTVEQKDMLKYLLGDPANAGTGGIYRPRSNVLGDIVNSEPVYVGAPDASTHANLQSYLDFVTSEQGRTPAVWVAANDGMLHAFDADTGKELFAYLPGAVITANIAGATWKGIANLADPNYGGINPHEYFNDGPLTVADAYINSQWKTVLVGTTGRGPARAIYAIDVTDPTDAKPLWERSADDGKSGSNYIGQIIGKPVIAQTSSGWQVFVGNGYNSTSGKAALLQFNLATGDLTAYTTDDVTDNGLAPPAIWIGNLTNGYGTTAYAGDLLGRVWSFNLGSASDHKGTKLFTAEDAGGNAQPITAGMLAGKDPNSGAVWVFFGTGRYLAHSDLSDLSPQTWYGLIVNPGPAQATDLTANLANGRTSLAKRVINTVAADPGASPPQPETRVITTGGASVTGKSGWYIDLQPEGDNTPHGERIVVPNQFQSGWLLATTRLPSSANLCNPTGTGWVMAIDPFTGANPSSVFFDLNGDNVFTSGDEVTLNQQRYAAAGMQFTAVPNAPAFVGSRMLTTLDNATRSNINTAGPTTVGQVSWRELVTHGRP